MNQLPQWNREYTLSVLKTLLETPSPTGYTERLLQRLSAEAETLGYRMDRLAKGGGLITVPGQTSGAALCLSAHVDTLGAMVRSVKDNGALRFSLIGGYMLQSIENEYCLIHTRNGRDIPGTILTTQPSVHVYPQARDLKRDEANYEIRLDEPVLSKEDVAALGISTGDFISFDPRPVFFQNGYIKSRHLDDKAGVAVLFSVLEMLASAGIKPRRSLIFLFSNYEEVGHGAAFLPSGVEEMLAIDMGAIGEDLACTERDVSICAKDSTGPYDWRMTTRLMELANRLGLKFAVDIYPRYGSDASAALAGGHNIRAALIGPGVHASHAMERTHEDALRHTSALAAAYALE